MLKNVYYYVDHRGSAPVVEFLDSLPKAEAAKCLAYIQELKIQGYNLRRPLADYIGDGIYELRPKNNRIFYFFFMKNNVVLIHAIKKKTNEILEEDKRLCVKRKREAETLRRLRLLEL
ncbi:MAG: type II toxin-antitoxin system RelE/ParE family toxin [Candidatus Omnitrophica bacterium]|nr:type II toxin-antitoxin system RelE/ParE family toxin [Candidatus Omnitrophota bacterium]